MTETTTRLLDELGSASREALLKSLESEYDETGPRQPLCCARCARAVTRVDQAVERDGGHVHRRSNPAGVSFVIGCFRSAGGCRAVGEPTDYWSWFVGHRWQAALCAGCGRHLGWRFSGASEFHGLILERLKPCGVGAD
ncbi:MAG: hypothetical protein GWO02_09840 [Gammaproteobacteria bacterium]|nr:hypothetical protein [Gammaproteobacteria bacterium]